ncbi:hypothetical protein [Streptomyces sp. GESEQ-4]|uniref:hypothetical protein n=1 Tax=Streptomyces sp. GESEQ-4 TaxID=2812655 RepID=UPI001B33C1BF|nr:hypothetical protein [Streptomyces sp. GESEQ-4]
MEGFVVGSGDDGPEFKGRGEHVLEVPDGLPGGSGGRVILEAWAGFLAPGFQMYAVRENGRQRKEEFLGRSGVGRGRAHVLFPVGIYPRIRIDGGVRSPGRWNVRFLALDSLPELATENTAEASRFFRVSVPGVEVSVEFGSAGGCLALYSFEGKERQVLTRHSRRFEDVVTIPRAGLLAVEGEDLAWGAMTSWSVRVRRG